MPLPNTGVFFFIVIPLSRPTAIEGKQHKKPRKKFILGKLCHYTAFWCLCLYTWRGLAQSFCSLGALQRLETTFKMIFKLRIWLFVLSSPPPPVKHCSWLFKIRKHNAKSRRFHVWLGTSHGNLDKIQLVPCPAKARSAKKERLHLFFVVSYH